MRIKINRRAFMKRGVAFGAFSFSGISILSGFTFRRKAIDISVVKGSDYLASTRKSIEVLGGMEQFVKSGSKVAILANPQRNNPGTYTSPEVLRGAIQLCKESGAKEVTCLSLLREENWESTGLKRVVNDEKANLMIVDNQDDSLFTTVPIPKGKALREARIMNAFFDYDVFIDIPITL